MSKPDLNLLFALDVLLEEESVAAAARRLRLSPSAMSRTLARLRDTTGDPLLVRAGRGLVATPRALEIREQVSRLILDGESVLRPTGKIDAEAISRTFTFRTSDGFAENFGPEIISRVNKEAPGVQVRFVRKTEKDNRMIREGLIDLETGVVGKNTSPELRVKKLFRDRFVGAVRKDHALSSGKITLSRFADERHISVSRRPGGIGPVDRELQKLGFERKVVAAVDGFSAALTLARSTEFVVCVPEKHTLNLRSEMFTFKLPLRVPEFNISLIWHPRFDADQAHRWFRKIVLETCTADSR
ncbi:MAG: LysR family transcriptional regulator [Pyrinomonadaceae bacterium]